MDVVSFKQLLSDLAAKHRGKWLVAPRETGSCLLFPTESEARRYLRQAGDPPVFIGQIGANIQVASRLDDDWQEVFNAHFGGGRNPLAKRRD